MANAMIEQSGDPDRRGPPARPRRRRQPERPLRADQPRTSSTTAGSRSRNCRPSRPRCRSRSRARSSPATSSPDISFDRSINPYRGCEHGCVYCFARPTHAYMGLSPGLDFEIEAVRQAGCREAAREGARQGRLPAAHHRHRHQHRSLPADREAVPHHARGPGGAGARTAIRSASSPSRRWSCATSTSCRAWPSAGSPRWRCR